MSSWYPLRSILEARNNFWMLHESEQSNGTLLSFLSLEQLKRCWDKLHCQAFNITVFRLHHQVFIITIFCASVITLHHILFFLLSLRFEWAIADSIFFLNSASRTSRHATIISHFFFSRLFLSRWLSIVLRGDFIDYFQLFFLPRWRLACNCDIPAIRMTNWWWESIFRNTLSYLIVFGI